MISLAFKDKKLIKGSKYETLFYFKDKKVRMEIYYDGTHITTSYITEII